MKKILSVLVTILAFNLSNAQSWTKSAGGDDFDGRYKTSSVRGTGDYYPYKTPLLVVNKFDKSGVNLYLSGTGYWSDDSNLSVKVKFNNDEAIYSSYNSSTSRDNKIIFFKTFTNSTTGARISQTEFIGKLMAASSVSMRVSNNYGTNNLKFSLRGSTAAINYVIPGIAEKLVEAKAISEKQAEVSNKVEQLLTAVNMDFISLAKSQVTTQLDANKTFDSLYVKKEKGVMGKKYGYVDVFVVYTDKSEDEILGTFGIKPNLKNK